jgi:hypothetical protein
MGAAANMFDDDRRVSVPRPEPEQDYPRRSAPPKGKGMSLGSKSKQSNDVLKAIQAEDALAGLSGPPPASASASRERRPQQNSGSGAR